MQIENCRAVVTGAGAGIGRGIALALANDGAAHVICADFNPATAESTAAELRTLGTDATSYKVDVGQRHEIEALADYAWSRAGGVDILFNNAGVSRVALGFDLSDADITWLMQVNIIGVLNGTRIFGRRMLRAPSKGWICNTASEAGVGGDLPMLATYAGTKHFVIGFTDGLRADYGDRLGLSVLCPGVVASEMWKTGQARPAALGGPIEGDLTAKAYMEAHGIPADVAGRIAVDGVKEEAFFIWTDPHTIEHAEARYNLQQVGHRRQWPTGFKGTKTQPFRLQTAD
jgi:meso-butanediol dehydrogenase / (S,S)-butanediol dehydrogenase / diacetyl reductase